jgi:hypothetical protein
MATEDIPVQYTHSVKLEDTAKAIRISVHVYANDREAAINQAIQTYVLTKKSLENMKIPVAPMEVLSK